MLEGNYAILKAGRIFSWVHRDKAVDGWVLSQEHVELWKEEAPFKSCTGGQQLQVGHQTAKTCI